MSGSDLLRFHEVRDAYRLIGECRDLGSDPALWFQRLVEGLCTLAGADAATGGEGVWVEARQRLEARSAHGVGYDESGLRSFRDWHREVGPARCPIFLRLARLPALHVTRSRFQLVPDREWYRSPSFFVVPVRPQIIS
jgi:hypothetical protein